jgi:hypothetical protein
MRNINAEELALLAVIYHNQGEEEKAKKYEQEFDELQREYDRD